jgi:hypothetical protein
MGLPARGQSKEARMLKWLMSWGNSSALELEERRRSVRHSCDQRSKRRLRARVGRVGWPASVSDLSATGVGLVLGMRQEPGSCVPVCLFNLNREVSHPVQVQVVHTKRRSDGYWYTGCAFQGTLQNADLEALL